MRTPKFKIYENVVCLEQYSTNGGKWWDQGFGLGYTPYLISNIRQVRFGVIKGTTQEVLAVQKDGQWVAINLPRSDIFTLQQRGLWPEKMRAPYEHIPAYTPPPEGC